MTFIRRIKKPSGTYLAEVESYRKDGKVKQRVIKYLGKEVNEKAVKRVSTIDLELMSIKQSLDINVIHHLAKKLGISDIENPYWLVLVYSQLIENHSISNLSAWVKNTEIPEILGIKEISSAKLYNSLGKMNHLDFHSIERNIYKELSRFEKDSDAAIIDVTDTYFEGKSIQTKRRKGKDGKTKRLIQIGLAVTHKWGFPIMHKVYEGNLSDKCILKDMALSLKKMGVTCMIMDRGMLSPKSLKSLLGLGYQTIAGLSKISSLLDEFITGISKDEIYCLKNRVDLVNTAVYIKSYEYMDGTLIVCYNPKTEYVRKENEYQKGEESKNSRYAGFSLIYHNTGIKDKDVVKQYYEKDVVERAFRQLKGVLNIRPVRVWLKENIKSHIKICYLSYAILTLLGYKTRRIMSPIKALDSLKYGYKATIRDKKNNHEWQMSVPLKSRQQDILKAVGCSV